MSTTKTPPKIPSVPSGIPASEWASTTESILSSDSVKDEPRQQPTSGTTAAPDVTTSGFPGSYPKEHEQLGTQQHKGEHAGPSVGTSVVQTARQYMPTQVERGVEYAGQAAAPYLPQGVTDTVVSYWKHDEEMRKQEEEHHTSLPSAELKGAQPSEHTGGVGALPGTISESSVALLPDERAARSARTPIRAETPQKETPLKGAVDSPEAGATRATATPKDEVQPQEQGARTVEAPVRISKPEPIPIPFSTQLYPPRVVSPTADKNKELPPRPSKVKETAFVKPAEESVSASKATQKKSPQEMIEAEGKGVVLGVSGGQRTQFGGDVGKETKMAAGAAAGVGAAAVTGERTVRKDEESRGRETTSKMVGQPDKGHERRDMPAKIEETQLFGNQKAEPGGRQELSRDEGGAQVREEEEGKKHTLTTKGSGYEGDYHPSELHPPPAGASVAEYGRQAGPPAAAVSPKGEYAPPPAGVTQPGSSGSPSKRVSFMAKVKGEAKIIAGKMSGKEEKVEEGKRMVHGDL